MTPTKEEIEEYKRHLSPAKIAEIITEAEIDSTLTGDARDNQIEEAIWVFIINHLEENYNKQEEQRREIARTVRQREQ